MIHKSYFFLPTWIVYIGQQIVKRYCPFIRKFRENMVEKAIVA